MTRPNPQHFQSHLLSEESQFYYPEQPSSQKTWESRIIFFLLLYKTPPLSLKRCQKAYPGFPELYSTDTVIHTCALCTSVTTSAQETVWGFTLQGNPLGTDQQYNHFQTGAKRMNREHESLQAREGKTACCTLLKSHLFRKGPRWLQL